MCFKVDIIKNIGDNWLIADFGTDDDGEHYIVTTDHIHASEAWELSRGAKYDAELVCKLLKEHYRKIFDEKYQGALPFRSYSPPTQSGDRDTCEGEAKRIPTPGQEEK